MGIGRRGSPAGLITLAMAAAGCAAVPDARVNVDSVVPTVQRASDRLAGSRRVADWQLAHLHSFDYVRTFQTQTADPLNWIQAVFYAGLADFADATGEARYAEALERHGEAHEWGFQSRPRHADADAIGHAWIWSAKRHDGKGRTRRLAQLRARFDAVLASPSQASLMFDEAPGEAACQSRWCWSDAVFMAPPVWTALSRVTGDTRYGAHAKRELDATIEALYDLEEDLFYRDSRFFDRRGQGGQKIFWSRGNGWAYAGLAKVLQSLPADDPDRARYEALFRRMSARIITLQGAAGYWPVSLLEPGGPPETSGTAFFVYGLAWGVNSGLLTPQTYGASAARGWRALEAAVQPDGRLGWVQQVGYAPDQVAASDTQLYGVGAYLMAAAEMSRGDMW